MNIDQIAMCYISMNSSNELYKVIKSFCKIFFHKFWPKTKKYSKE